MPGNRSDKINNANGGKEHCVKVEVTRPKSNSHIDKFCLLTLFNLMLQTNIIASIINIFTVLSTINMHARPRRREKRRDQIAALAPAQMTLQTKRKLEGRVM